MRPTNFNSFDRPGEELFAFWFCVDRVLEDGTCQGADWCRAWCDERGVLHTPVKWQKLPATTGPWRYSMDGKEKVWRHSNGWNNQFAFPWEVGMMYNLTVTGDVQRPAGCEGLDEPFGSLPEANWPMKTGGDTPETDKGAFWHSPVMKCGLNEYSPDGKPMHQIIDELASDNEHFAEMFLEAWQMLTSNGDRFFHHFIDLKDGPQNGWLGHYSLSQQGIDVGDFEDYIASNAPVTFTDKTADPYICGHSGHFVTSCGIRFSDYKKVANGYVNSGFSCDLGLGRDT